MKLGKILARTGDADGSSKTYIHILIENLIDAKMYWDVYAPITAKKNMNAWFGFKSQTFRQSINDYLTHEGTNTAPETRVLAMTLDFKETSTSLVEFCTMSDNLMLQKYDIIKSQLGKEKGIVRINREGGVGILTLDELSKYDEFIEITEENIDILQAFIICGEIHLPKIEINKEIIIIENTRDINERFVNELYKIIDKDKIQIINRFKAKGLLLKSEDYIKIFQKGIDNGLRTICFSTTGQDMHNLRNLHRLLMKLLEMNLDKKFILYISSWQKNVKDLFTNTENLEVINIKS